MSSFSSIDPVDSIDLFNDENKPLMYNPFANNNNDYGASKSDTDIIRPKPVKTSNASTSNASTSNASTSNASTSKLDSVRVHIEDAKQELLDNIDVAVDRRNKVDKLVGRTDQLTTSSFGFKHKSKVLRRQIWCDYIKSKAMIITIALIILTIIVIVIISIAKK